jgi:hypothetical protein
MANAVNMPVNVAAASDNFQMTEHSLEQRRALGAFLYGGKQVAAGLLAGYRADDEPRWKVLLGQAGDECYPVAVSH